MQEERLLGAIELMQVDAVQDSADIGRFLLCPDLMGLTLSRNGLEGIHGQLHEAPVYDDLSAPAVDAYKLRFPALLVYRLPGQWT